MTNAEYRHFLSYGCGIMLRVVGVVLAVGLCVTGCGPAAMDDVTVEQLTEQGVDPDLIFRVDLPGFTVVEQSAKPVGDGGFSMTYVSDSDPAHRVEFRTQSTEFTHEMCISTPIPGSDGALPTECSSDKGLYRSSGGFNEYIRPVRNGFIRLSAPIDALGFEDMAILLWEPESLWGPASQP